MLQAVRKGGRAEGVPAPRRGPHSSPSWAASSGSQPQSGCRCAPKVRDPWGHGPVSPPPSLCPQCPPRPPRLCFPGPGPAASDSARRRKAGAPGSRTQAMSVQGLECSGAHAFWPAQDAGEQQQPQMRHWLGPGGSHRGAEGSGSVLMVLF